MSLLSNSAKVLIFVGTGGVGKTSTSAAVGYLAAQQGKKVLIITIDPAQRLKTTLELKESGEIQKLNLPDLKGELFASLLNSKKIFDDFVVRAAGSSQLAQTILNNKLYIQLSTTLSGSQEFTALELLYTNYKSNEFDLIIVDTPPAQHAIDFLRAPQQLSTIFNEGVAKWFRDPKGTFWNKLFQTSTRQVLKILETFTGSFFMKELAAFFASIQEWQLKIQTRTIDFHNLLTGPDCQFCLVTSFDEAKLLQSQNFYKELKKDGYLLSNILVNKSKPIWLENITQDVASQLSPEWKQFYNSVVSYYEKRNNDFQNQKAAFGSGITSYLIPEIDDEIKDVQTLKMFAELIGKVCT